MEAGQVKQRFRTLRGSRDVVRVLGWIWERWLAAASLYPLPVSPLPQCMLIFIIGGLVILAYCSQASNERTYQEVVWAVCGKVPGVLCEVAIAVYTFGTCIAFLIIIGDQEDKSECPKEQRVASLLLERGKDVILWVDMELSSAAGGDGSGLDLSGLFQPKWLCDSVTYLCPQSLLLW